MTIKKRFGLVMLGIFLGSGAAMVTGGATIENGVLQWYNMLGIFGGIALMLVVAFPGLLYAASKPCESCGANILNEGDYCFDCKPE